MISEMDGGIIAADVLSLWPLKGMPQNWNGLYPINGCILSAKSKLPNPLKSLWSDLITANQ
jgi:hypothetical protein